ncbi:MAG: ABC transporter ATP-binding protein [Bdellovibrionales bacterium]|nr:ABC transporter ATP-binding protein [Bdellovibrionales bacterium]
MVIVEGLTKYYGQTLALDKISFDFTKGDVVGLLGPNGAGKSTTMKILTGFMPPSSGKVMIQDIDVGTDPIAVKKRIGFLPEHAPLYLDMTVSAYLRYVGELKQVDKNHLKKYVSEAIEQTNLVDVQSKNIKTLSKGYRQRLGIAQALLAKPDLIILDEPTVGLDPKQVIEIRQLIKTLSVDRTLLLSSHILSEVEAVCNKVVIMNKGKVLARESVSKLTSKVSQATYELLAPKDFDWASVSQANLDIQGLQPRQDGWVEFTVTGNKELHQIMKTFIENKIPFTELRKKETSLEEAYLQLVTKDNN